MEPEYSAPQLEELVIKQKPFAYGGREFPLSQMHSRDFEKLVYSAYKLEIANKNEPYDDIALMRGVKDEGQDCALYQKGTKVAVIQCKHSMYEHKLSLSSCMQELIKFCLYSIKNPRLIPNPNDFTYMLVTSFKLEPDDEAYFRSFRNSIEDTTKIKMWVGMVLRSVKSLGDLNPELAVSSTLELLSSIAVQTIPPENIQIKLAKHQSVIAKMFFEVKLVTDNSEIQALGRQIEALNEQARPRPLDPATVLEEFSVASTFLSDYGTTFSLNSPISIKRKATAQLLDWVMSPLSAESSNAAILKGGAGSGKSVILNHLYFALKGSGIPCLGLKADIKAAHSIEELEKGLGLTNSIIESVNLLKEEHAKIVIIIDQIDALSQTLSASRDFLGTYMTLIAKLSAYDSVRLVISVREYDLEYDPLLIPLKKNKPFEVKRLEEKDVADVLDILQVSNRPPSLIDLLKTPLHLELFCKVYNASDNPPAFNSLYDLYNALWQQKMEALPNKIARDEAASTVSAIAASMYEKQRLHINSSLFDSGIIKFLMTQGLIRRSDKSGEIVFFHQTFYDYAFARQFVESKTSVIDYLNDNIQGLHIRSSLRIILAHLREYSAKEYRTLLGTLLLNKGIRFHLKLLTLNYLGFIDNPNTIEISIVEDHVIGTPLEDCFMESISTRAWSCEALERGWISKLMSGGDLKQMNLAFQFYRRNMRVAYDSLIAHLLQLPDDEESNNFIYQVLLFIPSWNADTSKLYARVRDRLVSDPFRSEYCLEKSVAWDEGWAHEEYKRLVKERVLATLKEGRLKLDHHDSELLKYFYDFNPVSAFELHKSLLEEIAVSTAVGEEGDYLQDSRAFIYFSRKDRYSSSEELLGMFMDKTDEMAKSEPKRFRVVADSLIYSRQSILLRVVIEAYLVNPEEYGNDIYTLFMLLHKHDSLSKNSNLEYKMRKLIRASFPYFMNDQKSNIIEAIAALTSKDALQLYTHPVSGKRTRLNYIGNTKYLFLREIPEDDIKAFPHIYRTFNELRRQFGNPHDSEPNIFRAYRVPAPYTAKSYELMSLDDWENTFRKYQDTGDNSREISVIEHSRTFEAEVSKRPDFFYPLVKRIIEDNTINNDYQVDGLIGLMKAKYETSKLQELYEHLLSQGINQENLTQILWATDHLIKINGITTPIMDFLCHQALANPNPDKEDIERPLDLGINSVRGAAIDRLMRINDKNHSEKLFETAERLAANERNLAVNATFISHCAYLLNHDKRRAFKVFMTAVSKDTRMLQYGMWSAGYFATSYFLEMDSFFEAADKIEECHEGLTVIYYSGWLKGVEGAEQRLFALLKGSKVARREAARVAMNSQNLIQRDRSLEPRCLSLIDYTIGRKHKDIWREYSNAFLRFETSDFDVLLPVLLKYSKSLAFRHYPANFCEYLTKCCSKKTVKDCVSLVTQLDKLFGPDGTSDSFYRQEPINSLLAVYNTLGNDLKSVKDKKQCMDTFDKMLLQPQHREVTYRAIELADLSS